MSEQARDLLTLLHASGTKFYALLVRLTLREDVADDLMQDLFIRLSDAKGFQVARNPEAFAYTTAIRLAFDWRRRQSREKSKTLIDEPVAPNRAALDQLADDDEVQKVLVAMEQLVQRDREILVLRYLEQESYETIAAMRTTTVHQARAQCHKAMTRLRGLLNIAPHKEARRADA